MGVNLINKYQKLVISKSGKSHNKIVKVKLKKFVTFAQQLMISLLAPQKMFVF